MSSFVEFWQKGIRSIMHVMLFVGPLSFVAPSTRIVAPARAATSMGLFDQFSKAFANNDYSESPATYEQTNARACKSFHGL